MSALTPEQERARRDAFLRPAPNLPAWELRPFSFSALDLCAELGLKLFTLEEIDRSKIDQRTLTRECFTVLYMLGKDPLDEMLRTILEPDAYERHIRPWVWQHGQDATLIPRLLAEWQRFMVHYAASMVKVLPREEEKPGETPPPNSSGPALTPP